MMIDGKESRGDSESVAPLFYRRPFVDLNCLHYNFYIMPSNYDSYWKNILILRKIDLNLRIQQIFVKQANFAFVYFPPHF